MDKYLIFYKEEDNRWYVDLPEWEGDKADLEMVSGADTMLEILSQGEGRIEIGLCDTEPDNPLSILTLTEELNTTIGGGYYNFDGYGGIEYDMQIWLCDVTKFVYGYMPEKLYINSIIL